MNKQIHLIILLMTCTVRIMGQVPLFAWAKGMGGLNGDGVGFSITTDNSGNIYTAGYFLGIVDFDPGIGVYNLTSTGLSDLFITKFDPSGNMIWAKRIGGTGYDYAYKIIVDTGGNVFSTGSFFGVVDFDPGPATFNLTAMGTTQPDIFISKLDSSGNFVWAKKMGGLSEDVANSIATDAAGNIYTAGYFKGQADFDPDTGVFSLTAVGTNGDAFISKLNSSGNFILAKRIGGSGATSRAIANGITADMTGKIYITGSFGGIVDFDPDTSTYSLYAPMGSVFIARFDSSGNFNWATGAGSGGGSSGENIVTDAANNVFVTGRFWGTIWNGLIDAGTGDAFVVRINAAGNFDWVRALGGAEYDIGYGIDVDNTGNVYTTGYFEDTADFDPSFSSFNLTASGTGDIYISKLDSNGFFKWAGSMGGNPIAINYGYSIAVDGINNIYTTGTFMTTTDFDPGAGIYNLNGASDIFIHKMSQTPVGIPENEFSNSFIIFPSPAQDYFTVTCNTTLNKGTINMFNIFGEIIFEENIYNESNKVINLKNISGGIYFVKVYDGEKYYCRKIIVKHN